MKACASDLLLTGRTMLAAGLAVLLVIVSGAVAGGSLPPIPLVRTVAVGRMPSAMAVDTRRGRVFVADEGANSVSMLDARRGRLLRTVPVGPAPTGIAVDAQAGHVLIVNQGTFQPAPAFYSHEHGTVTVLDARSGTVLRTVTVGYGPRALALDARRGRAFVANRYDGTVSVLDVA